jgi:hypothetical protein
LKRALALAALLAAAPACHHDQNAVLLIVVTASGTPPVVASLDVTLTTGRTAPSTNSYAHGTDPILFPTTLSAELPGYATGDVSIEVRADDAAGATVASGRVGPIPIHPGERQTVYVRLDCGGDACIVDGGTGNDDGGMPSSSPRCGNGRIDLGETCDTAIPPGDPGGCPLSCDDHIGCTRDTRAGSDCTVSCSHERIDDPAPGDGCCPPGYTYDGVFRDSDCSPTCGNGVVDKGETCDTAIPPGRLGACPTTADCKPITCAMGDVISLGTCSAVCTWQPMTVPSGKAPDNCCPPGATNANDSDCPTACGNGVLEDTGGEHCDPGIPAGMEGACPTTCDDGKACTIDYFLIKGCQALCGHTDITTPISGDGCCPDGATNATDADCAPVCGNGVVERGERCDGDCPTTCPVPKPDPIGRPGCLVNEVAGDPYACTAHCEITAIDACKADKKDGCCPDHCTAAEDPDCSPACGDGFVQATLGETCDIGMDTNVCPKSCDDQKPCTDDYLVGAGTCSARCVHMPVTDPRPGDGCCLPGRTFYLDPDCPSTCGDGVVDRPAEICDFGAGASCPGPETCQSNDACTTYVVTGRADNCSAACVAMPVTACVGGDHCCPAGCTAVDDSDCPVICGDGVVETSESCDRAITAGHPGACARTCDDGDACTFDQASGSVEGCSRACSHARINACIPDDGCCPAACSAANDSDCAPKCGDKRVGAGETCDPSSSCPTTCADDGDPCTTEQLTGSSETCNATCRHVPITACSGTKNDRCCPTGCTRGTDSDC